ncbi:hypothetical protein CEG14_14765 [Bordetella genomosp. 1]|uniref:Radical SAM core domain-containing protein n=1 Tax=Bordetella genomosp. 1 TaxID=1395607 RepID=A0A261SH52_9BORD|nr:radical SAM protein [Bordetella genomosp. 1]OZI36272.1 hypothetical protein CEG14_14765 [Bordetella genomosp. 1]
MELSEQDSENFDWKTFDLSRITERFRLKNAYGSQADKLELETRRFLYLSAKFKNEKLAPSEAVDAYWHELILNTEVYSRFCQNCFGLFVDHVTDVPTAASAAFEFHQASYYKTIELYKREFEGAPDIECWPTDESRLESRVERYRRPFRVHIETTNHCNLRCEHCYPESSIENPHHPRQLIDRAIAEAKKMDVNKITLTGGEILTRPDWKEIFSNALDVCDNVYFITNGLLLTKKKLEWLTRQKALRSLRNWRRSLLNNQPVEIGVAISLDGLAGNELVRKSSVGGGIPASKIIERISLAVRYGLHVTVNTTITNALSARELPEMYKIIAGLGIDRWQIDQAYLAGRLSKSPLSRVPLSWLEEAKPSYKYIVENYLKNYPKIPPWRLEIVQVFRYDNLFYGFSPARSLTEHPCSYHFGSMIVEQGDWIRFCPSLRDEAIGSISQSGSVEAVYETPKFKDFLSKSILNLPCKDCRYGALFHGGCRANSLAYAGSIWDADPICCSLSPFVEDEIVPLLPDSLRKEFFASLRSGLRPGQLTSLPGRKSRMPVFSINAERPLSNGKGS